MAHQYQQYQQQPAGAQSNFYQPDYQQNQYQQQPYGQPPQNQPPHAAPFGSSGTEPVQRQFPIPSNKSGNIIGKGGSIIRQTRQTTGCHIKIMDTEPGARDRMVILNGTELQVRNAYYTILGQLEGHGQPVGGAGYGGGGGGGGAPGGYQTAGAVASTGGETHQVIAVDNSMVGALIGKGGSVIKNIRQTSGAMVKISGAGESSDPSKRIVTIWGGNDAVLCAQQMIFTQLQQSAQDASGGGRGGGGGGHGGGGGGQQMQMTSTGDVVLNLSVANEVAGSLIGRGGSNIKELRRLSGAQIRIGDRLPGQAMRTITVIGTAQQLQVAQELISGQINSGGGGYITGNAAAAAAAAGAYVPDAAAATATEAVTVAPAPADPVAAYAPEPAIAPPLLPGPIPTMPPAPAPAAPVGVSSYASPSPTKRKAEEEPNEDEGAAQKKTKTESEPDAQPAAEPEEDSQSLTTKWMDNTVVKIKAEMKRQGLDISGRKADLVERLVAHLLS